MKYAKYLVFFALGENNYSFIDDQKKGLDEENEKNKDLYYNLILN